MKKLLSDAVRALCAWPLVGRPARVGAALLLLPDWRDRIDHARAQQQSALDQQRHALEHQISHLRQALSELQERQAARADLDRLLESVPVSLRNLAFDQQSNRRQCEQMEARFNALSGNVDYLVERVEFVRREVMFEMRYGADKATPARPAEAQILAAEKVAQARRNGIRLNLGCGHLPMDGYINVDRRPLPGVDVVAEVDALPFGTGEVAEIWSAHLLEHFPQEQLRRQLLPAFHAMLVPGGRLRAVVPDAEAMMAAHARGALAYEDLREVTFGAQDYDGDFHYNMFTPVSLSGLLAEAGFGDITVVEAGRRNGRCYEFEMSAVKPTAGMSG